MGRERQGRGCRAVAEEGGHDDSVNEGGHASLEKTVRDNGAHTPDHRLHGHNDNDPWHHGDADDNEEARYRAPWRRARDNAS